jgi:hypothetical protein
MKRGRPHSDVLLFACCALLLCCGRIGFVLQREADASSMDDAGERCTESDVDSDGDGRCDIEDLCPDADDEADADGDGFPDACDKCGDGVLDTSAGETCDPGLLDMACPSSCADDESCTRDTLAGNVASCDVVCINELITTPFNEDGCCPQGANNTNDSECEPSCGNGVTESTESCDPGGLESACPSACDDESACTDDDRSGDPDECDVTCTFTPITALVDGDLCCPPGANNTTDSDCSPACGNGTIESGETCDPPESCPTDCEDGDACTQDTSGGAPQNCDVACTNAPIVLPFNGDGCCPAGANNTNDIECAPVCGNGIVESGEQCDGSAGCTGSCLLDEQGQCLAYLGALPNTGIGYDPCSECACSRCAAQMLDCYRDGNDQRDQRCPAVVECGLDENCVGDCDSDFRCYGEFCWWGGNYPYYADGECKNQLSSAAGGTTDPATAQNRASNPAYPAYWSEEFTACLQSVCWYRCNL